MIGGEKDECNENGCKTKHLFRKNDNNNSSSSVYFNFFIVGYDLPYSIGGYL